MNNKKIRTFSSMMVAVVIVLLLLTALGYYFITETDIVQFLLYGCV